jgi:hypothetical protein
MPDWIAFRPGTIPASNGYMQEMTADTFVRIVDPQSTHARSMVLAARLLWPEEHEKIYEHIRYSFKRPTTCGLEREEDFEAVWSTPNDAGAIKDFAECILERLLIMEQPFLQDILPNIMVPYMGHACSAGLRVAKYQLFQGVLTFWLDTRGYEESTTEYRLSFCTGDVTSPNGDGIIHNMYGMKQFFEQAGNTNLMASLLAEKGITSKMRFDQHDESGSGVWRIFDETSGVWKHHKGDHQPEDIISEYIKQELRPLKEMEFFFGRDLAWERRKAAVDEPLEGEAVEVCPEDSASQSGRSVGSKRSRNTMSSLSRMYKSRLTIESALYKYCKVPREQAEIQHKVSVEK